MHQPPPARQLAAAAAAIVASLGLVSTAGANATPGRCDACASSSSARALRLVDEINLTRRRNGLHTLVVSPALEQAAASHEQQMLSLGFFGHSSADGTPCWRRIEHWYPPKPRAAWAVDEALLAASPDVSASAALEHWLASPVHRRILLDPEWRNIGLVIVHAGHAPGVYRSQPTTVITADFGVR